MMPVPPICWEEGLSEMQEKELAQKILDLIRHRQVATLSMEANCYCFIPNPAPYASAESAMFAALPLAMARQIHSIRLPQDGKCYWMTGDETCLAFMAPTFHLGPPELTILAFPGGLISLQKDTERVRFIFDQLARPENFCAVQQVVGLHFDSGDLVEVF